MGIFDLVPMSLDIVSIDTKAMDLRALDERFPPGTHMDEGAVNELLAGIQPMRTPFPMFRFEGKCTMVERGYFVNLEMRAYVKVFDRENPGRTMDLTFNSAAGIPIPTDRHRVLYLVRKFLHYCVTHEMDECLLVHGVRFFDPHEGEPARGIRGDEGKGQAR